MLNARLVKYDADAHRAWFDLGSGSQWQALVATAPRGDQLALAVRPESLLFASVVSAGVNCVNGQIADAIYGGVAIRYQVRLENGQMLQVQDHNPDQSAMRQLGERVQLVCDPARVLVFEGGAHGS